VETVVLLVVVECEKLAHVLLLLFTQVLLDVPIYQLRVQAEVELSRYVFRKGHSCYTHGSSIFCLLLGKESAVLIRNSITIQSVVVLPLALFRAAFVRDGEATGHHATEMVKHLILAFKDSLTPLLAIFIGQIVGVGHVSIAHQLELHDI